MPQIDFADLIVLFLKIIWLVLPYFIIPLLIVYPLLYIERQLRNKKRIRELNPKSFTSSGPFAE